jgi:hypothetical protein
MKYISTFDIFPIFTYRSGVPYLESCWTFQRVPAAVSVTDTRTQRTFCSHRHHHHHHHRHHQGKYYVSGHFFVLSSSENTALFVFQNSFSETGFCLRLQIKPTQLGPIDRASPYLRIECSLRNVVFDMALN